VINQVYALLLPLSPCHPAAVVLIPAADSGVTDMQRCLPALRAMAEAGVLLLVHGEVTDPEVDMFDREAVFIETKLVSEGGRGLRLEKHLRVRLACRCSRLTSVWRGHENWPTDTGSGGMCVCMGCCATAPCDGGVNAQLPLLTIVSPELHPACCSA
jgi:hypothetical protein